MLSFLAPRRYIYSLKYWLLLNTIRSIEPGRSIIFFAETKGNGFYPKPRVALGKSPQPLRCNPVIIEQVGAQGDDRSAVGPSPPHAPLFHAAVDHQGHGSLDHATAHGIAKLAPVLIGPNPSPLVLQIRDRLLDGLKWLVWYPCSHVAQSLHRL